MTAKKIVEQIGSALRNGSQRNLRVYIDKPFQLRKNSVIGAPMKPPKKTRLCRITGFPGTNFAEAMEERVNDDDVGIQAVDAR